MAIHLDDLLNPEAQFASVLVYGKSNRYLSLVSNLVRKRFQVDSSSVVRVNDLNELPKMDVSIQIRPFRSPYRLFIVDEQKTELAETTLKFLQGISRFTRLVVGYTNYKLFQNIRYNKELADFQPDIMFSTYMTQSEFQYIYDVTTTAKGSVKLSEKMYGIVTKRYLRDIDAVFTILSSLKDGIEIRDNATLVQLAGVGSLQVERVALSMLTSTTKTQRGLEQYKKKQLQSLLELSHNRSFETVRKSLLESFKAILILKELLVEGKIYPEIGLLPDMSKYNNYRIGKYARSLEQIDALSMKEIVNFMSLVGGSKWLEEFHVVSFVLQATKLIGLKNGGCAVESKSGKIRGL